MIYDLGNCYIGYTGKDITEKMIYQAVKLDSLVYPDNLRGIFERCINWWKKNPYIYIMIKNNITRNIIGYISILPVNDSCYNKIKSGKFIDTNILPEDLSSFDNIPGIYKIYFSSIVIHPDFQNTIILKKLLYLFKQYISYLCEIGISFSSIIVDAISETGEKLCKHFGLNYILDTIHNSKIYEKDFKALEK